MKISGALAIMVMLGLVTSLAFAEETKRTAKIMDITGQAQVKRAGERSWVPAETGMSLTEGDTIRTKKDSFMILKLKGHKSDATVDIDQNAELLLREFIEDKEAGYQKTLLDLALGEIMIWAEKLSPESKFEVKTPASVAGVRGTKFSVKVEAVE